jgi:hypothetical protein
VHVLRVNLRHIAAQFVRNNWHTRADKGFAGGESVLTALGVALPLELFDLTCTQGAFDSGWR